MKQYKILILSLIISVLLISSCTDEFVDVKNPNQITVASFYQDENDALMAVNACYDPLMAVFGMPLQFIYYGYSGYTKHERESLDKMTFSTDLDMNNSVYLYLYRGIYRCNLVFENVEPTFVSD